MSANAHRPSAPPLYLDNPTCGCAVMARCHVIVRRIAPSRSRPSWSHRQHGMPRSVDDSGLGARHSLAFRSSTGPALRGSGMAVLTPAGTADVQNGLTRPGDCVVGVGECLRLVLADVGRLLWRVERHHCPGKPDSVHGRERDGDLDHRWTQLQWLLRVTDLPGSESPHRSRRPVHPRTVYSPGVVVPRLRLLERLIHRRALHVSQWPVSLADHGTRLGELQQFSWLWRSDWRRLDGDQAVNGEVAGGGSVIRARARHETDDRRRTRTAPLHRRSGRAGLRMTPDGRRRSHGCHARPPVFRPPGSARRPAG